MCKQFSTLFLVASNGECCCNSDIEEDMTEHISSDKKAIKGKNRQS